MDKSRSYQLSLYEKALPDYLSMEEKLHATRQYGFDALELSIDETDDKLKRLYDIELQQEIRHAMNKTGIPIRTLCLSGHRKYPLGALDKRTADTAISIFKRAVDLADYLGIHMIQLAGYDVYYEPSSELTYNQFIKNLRVCMEYTASKLIVCGFETMETPFMDTVQKAVNMCHIIQSPMLQLYPDLGNITNSNNLYNTAIEDDIASGRGHVAAVHLKDAKTGIYRDLQLGTGDVDFELCLKAFWNQGVRRFGCEFWCINNEINDHELKTNCSFARNILDKLCGGHHEH